MSKKCSRFIAGLMLFLGILFIGFAMTHPESSVKIWNTVLYTINAIYMLVMIILFIAPFGKK